jgi:hypothetical protein
MKNPFIVKPTGLKGNEKLNRMRELMGATSLNEDVKNSVVELTKLGPDGKVYGVVREGHNYFIKVTNKQSNIVTEDFNYIGGLMNKTSEVYTTYAKAIKQLNLKLMSLNEAYGKQGNFNTFENDNLLTENEASKDILDKSGEKLTYDSKEGKDESQFGDNVADKDVVDEFEKVKLSENEIAIDEMIVGEGESWTPEEKERISYFTDQFMQGGNDYHYAAAHAEGVVRQERKEREEKNKSGDQVAESKKGFSIERAMEKMDSIIGEDVTDKVNDLLNSLTESEKESLLNTLKKKD